MKPRREITVAVTKANYRCRKAGCAKAGDYAKGLCESDYKQVKRYIDLGLTTWAKLERQGKIAPSRITVKDWILS